MREIKKTPIRAVEDGRVVEWGLFDRPFRDNNLVDAQIYPDLKVPGFVRELRLKRWQHYAIIHPDIFMGFVIVDTHYMGSSFCYVVDRKSGEYIEHHCEKLGKTARVSRELWKDRCSFHPRGYDIEFQNRLDHGHHLIDIDIRKKGGMPGIRAKLEIIESLDQVEPLIVVLPISENRPLHTHKAACPIKGSISFGDRTIELDPGRDLAIIDVQKTFYPYNTFWKWATFAGYNEEGKLIAFNIVSNMIKDDETYNENVLWVDGKISPLAAARFELDESDFLKPWHITTTAEGECEVNFTPEGKRADKINMGLIMSDYHQPYGLFSGSIRDKEGTLHTFENLFGVTEYHKARF